MFGIKELRRDVNDALWQLFGVGRDPYKPEPRSIAGKAESAHRFVQEHEPLLRGEEPRYGWSGGSIPGQPPLAYRLRVIEEALGISYEYEDGPKWTHTVKRKKK